jgi:hypothetical protein
MLEDGPERAQQTALDGDAGAATGGPVDLEHGGSPFVLYWFKDVA